MDENQLRYKRLLSLTDEQVQYKIYTVILDYGYYTKRVSVRACCEQEIKDTTKKPILFIRRSDYEI